MKVLWIYHILLLGAVPCIVMDGQHTQRGCLGQNGDSHLVPSRTGWPEISSCYPAGNTVSIYDLLILEFSSISILWLTG